MFTYVGEFLEELCLNCCIRGLEIKRRNIKLVFVMREKKMKDIWTRPQEGQKRDRWNV